MSLAQQLWQANADWADRILAHPFVQGLGDGSLPVAAFKSYVAQDAYFLEAFARAYAFCLAHGTSRDDLFGFSELIAGVLEELKLHKSYTESLQVSLDGVTPLPATQAYVDFLLGTARRGQLGETIAGMTPCMRLYAFLGQTLAKKDVAPAYADWVKTYADPGVRGAGRAARRPARPACGRQSRRARELPSRDGTGIRLLRRKSSIVVLSAAKDLALLPEMFFGVGARSFAALRTTGDYSAASFSIDRSSAPCRSAVSLLPIAARTSCSAAAHSGSARLNSARPAGVATSSCRRLSPELARSTRPSLEQRLQVAGEGGAIGRQQLRQPADRDRTLGGDEPQQRELRDLEAGRRQVLAVDRGHPTGGAADAKAGALGGREARRGRNRHGRQSTAAHLARAIA